MPEPTDEELLAGLEDAPSDEELLAGLEDAPAPPDTMDRSQLRQPIGQAPWYEQAYDAIPGRTLAQGLTFGFGDELEARARSALGPDDYATSLARIRQKLATEKEELDEIPYTGGVGSNLVEFGGSLPLNLIPVVGQMKTAQQILNVGRAANRARKAAQGVRAASMATQPLPRVAGAASGLRGAVNQAGRTVSRIAPRLTNDMAEGAFSALGHADNSSAYPDTGSLKTALVGGALGVGTGVLGRGVFEGGHMLKRAADRRLASGLRASTAELEKLAAKHAPVHPALARMGFEGTPEALGRKMADKGLAKTRPQAVEAAADKLVRQKRAKLPQTEALRSEAEFADAIAAQARKGTENPTSGVGTGVLGAGVGWAAGLDPIGIALATLGGSQGLSRLGVNPLEFVPLKAQAATTRFAGHLATAPRFSRGVAAGQASNRLFTDKTKQAQSTADLVRQHIASNPLSLGGAGLLLQQAADKGPEEFRTQHFKLMYSDPNYRAALRKIEEDARKED